MPKRHPQTKRLESYSASNARSWGTWQGIAQSYSQNPVMNAPKQAVTNDTGEWTVPAHREGPGQPRLGVYRLKSHMTEKAQVALKSFCVRMSSRVRNLQWP
jgi:hypothetical protein